MFPLIKLLLKIGSVFKSKSNITPEKSTKLKKPTKSVQELLEEKKLANRGVQKNSVSSRRSK